jgi:hypothetical protein
MAYAQIEALAKQHAATAVGLDEAQTEWILQDIAAGEAESALLTLIDLAPQSFTPAELDLVGKAFAGEYGAASARQAIAKARSLVPA